MKQLDINAANSTGRYMTVKYMGEVEGQFGILSQKVAFSSHEKNKLSPNAAASSMSSTRQAGKVQVQGQNPDEEKMKRFSTPILAQKDVKKSVLFSDRKVYKRNS